MRHLLIAGIAALSMIFAPNVILAQAECDDDTIEAVVNGSTVTVVHANAHYNCCSTVPFTIAPVPGGYLLTETEEGPWCYCTCCVTLQARVEDVPPGEHRIVLRFFDYDTDDWREISTTVTVPDVGQGGETDLASAFKSPCGGLTSVPSGEPPTASWGLLKATYR